MRLRFRTSLLAGLAALFVVLIGLVVAGGFVVSARAQELQPRSVVALPKGIMPAHEPAVVQLSGEQMVVQHLAFRHAAPIALPVTNGERSSSLVLRAVVGLLLLGSGIMGRLLFRRRSAAS